MDDHLQDNGEYEQTTSLIEAVRTGDKRKSLLAIRDYLAHELEGNRCNRCSMSQLRTGDTAALVLRLTKVIEEIAELPAEGAAQQESELDKLRRRRRGATG